MPPVHTSAPERAVEAADVRPISRPNVNFDRAARPLHHARATSEEDVPVHSPRDSRLQDLLLSARIVENKVRRDASISATSSFNWWPYPPWGQSTSSLTSSETVTPPSSTPSPPPSVTSPPATSSSVTPAAALGVSIIPISTLPPATSSALRQQVQATSRSSFNPHILIPVSIVVGLLLGALSGFLAYRWYSRRRARAGGNNNNGTWGASFIPGPPYARMDDATFDAGGPQDVSLVALGSPSKYTHHGAPHKVNSWLSSVTRASSHRASLHSTVPLSRENTTAAATGPSHSSSAGSTRTRSRGSTLSPVSPSDGKASHYDTRNASIRRAILSRLQPVPDRSKRGMLREPSRRTAMTYQTMGSVYSGTHSGDSFDSSAEPTSASPLRGDTEWVPGSGFRIVEESIASPLPLSPSPTDPSPVSGLPGQTSAWESDEALRQAVDTHPGERWLAWTRNWTSSPPAPPLAKDKFTAPPSRHPTREQKDVEMLLRSPPQVTSPPLQTALTFSPPEPSSPPPRAPTKNSKRRRLQVPAPIVPAPPTARGGSTASSIAPGDGHGTPAMRYAARHMALSRVEEIVARSYSSGDLVPGSPNAFGAVPADSLEEEDPITARTAGIEHRLEVAAQASAADRR